MWGAPSRSLGAPLRVRERNEGAREEKKRKDEKIKCGGEKEDKEKIKDCEGK